MGAQSSSVPVSWQRGQGIAVSGGFLVVAVIIQVRLEGVLRARWHLAIGPSGDGCKLMTGTGLMVPHCAGRSIIEQTVMDWASPSPGSSAGA